METLLDDLRKRPLPLIGKKSLDRLTACLSGYIYCIYEKEGRVLEVLPGFQEFVERHYNLHNNIYVFRHWTDIICFFTATEEDAFDEFYKLLDEFETQRG